MRWEYHYEWWQRMTTPAPPPPPREPTTWDVEKSGNRLAKKLGQIARGVLQPRFQYTQQAPAEVAEAKLLLAEVAQTIRRSV